jgi:antirestriction protein ArdC
MTKPNSQKIRTEIAQRIIDAIKGGVPPWRRPWSMAENTGVPCNFTTPTRHYHGINELILWLSGFQSRHWGTAPAWRKELGAFIPATAEPTTVLLFSFVKDKVKKKKDGKPVERAIMRFYNLFNVEQVIATPIDWLVKRPKAELIRLAKSLKVFVFEDETRQEMAKKISAAVDQRLERYRAKEGAVRNADPDFAPAEAIIKSTKAAITHGGDRACYDFSTDEISVPHKKHFDSVAEYYETVFHELAHWCEKPKRVGRRKSADTAEDQYAFRELVADIAACCLCAEIGVPHAAKMLKNTAAYVDGWLKKMEGNPKYIFDAAAQAAKVVAYLTSLGTKTKKKAA